MREMADLELRDTLCDFAIKLKELASLMAKLWQLLSAPQGTPGICEGCR